MWEKSLPLRPAVLPTKTQTREKAKRMLNHMKTKFGTVYSKF
jgi:hypothetical protein